jgi:hypothetical protein
MQMMKLIRRIGFFCVVSFLTVRDKVTNAISLPLSNRMSSGSVSLIKSPVKSDFQSFNNSDRSFNNLKQQVTKTVKNIFTGFASLANNYVQSDFIKKTRREKGNQAITFSDYNFMKKVDNDCVKALRMMLTICISPDISIISYFIIPAFSKRNPFAWSLLPSGNV